MFVMMLELMWMMHVVVDAHESLAMFPNLALAGNYNFVMMMMMILILILTISSCFFLLFL
jgi:hypothetical protein